MSYLLSQSSNNVKTGSKPSNLEPLKGGKNNNTNLESEKYNKNQIISQAQKINQTNKIKEDNMIKKTNKMKQKNNKKQNNNKILL